ncbi:hypothetical protein [Cupriavidus nantongensis]|uniref:Uncharacterized protein n=1 Tax=Cupriavidus nantongensis TaxID=1796606 RepID=A0A142JHU7_9BURK|nr:hypothetical protein [Cupriavidus nantongensis]AMR77659.1 hypothetical protein A2G96_07885 [Cupriavidus nantongensis]
MSAAGSKHLKRLTPMVPGEMQPVLWPDGKVREGFYSGEATHGRGFPQWALQLFGGNKAHWFLEMNSTPDKRSLCGRVWSSPAQLHLPGNYPRCKACEKAREAQQRAGVMP